MLNVRVADLLVVSCGCHMLLLQDIDQLSLFKSIVKFSATCNTVRDIVPTLRRAFQVCGWG